MTGTIPKMMKKTLDQGILLKGLFNIYQKLLQLKNEKNVRRLSMDYGQKVIRSLENSTPASQTQDTQPFSPSASQTLAVPSTVPSESRETDIYDEAPIHLADIAIKIERVTQDLSPKTSDNKDLNNSYEYDSEAQALLLKGKIFLRNVRLVVES